MFFFVLLTFGFDSINFIKLLFIGNFSIDSIFSYKILSSGQVNCLDLFSVIFVFKHDEHIVCPQLINILGMLFEEL